MSAIDFFGWLTKPKLMVTGLDVLVMFLELAVLFMFFGAIWEIRDQRRRSRIKKAHGIHCTCWTCMGDPRG